MSEPGPKKQKLEHSDDNISATDRIRKLEEQLAATQATLKSSFDLIHRLARVVPSRKRDCLRWENLDNHMKNSPEMVIIVLKKEPESLKWEDIPLSLRENRNVAFQAFKSRFISWSDVKDEYSNDVDFCLGAFLSHRYSSLEDYPCLTKTILANAIATHAHHSRLWEKLPVTLRSNPTFCRLVVFASAETGDDNKVSQRTKTDCKRLVIEILKKQRPLLCSERDVWNRMISEYLFKKGLAPDAIRDDRELMHHAFLKIPSLLHLNCDSLSILKRDPDFVRTLLIAMADSGFEHCNEHAMGHNSELTNAILEMLKDCKSVLKDRRVWEKLIQSRQLSMFLFFSRAKSFVPDFVFNDKTMMLGACKRDHKCWSYCHPSLREDFDFVQELVDHNPTMLNQLSDDFVERYPEFVKSTFALYSRHEEDWDFYYYHNLAFKMRKWLISRDDFCRAWFEAGLPLNNNCFPSEWTADKEKLLLVAERCPDSDSRRHDSFMYLSLSDAVADDSDFIQQISQCDPYLYMRASPRVKSDCFDLAVQAAAFDFEMFPLSEHHLAQVGELLSSRNVFLNPFLCGLKYPCPNSKMLSELNSIEIIMLIADFVGLPRGKDLRQLRLACWNAEEDSDDETDDEDSDQS